VKAANVGGGGHNKQAHRSPERGLFTLPFKKGPQKPVNCLEKRKRGKKGKKIS